MRRFPALIYVLGVTAASVLLASCSRHDETVVLKLAHVLDINHSVHQGLSLIHI